MRRLSILIAAVLVLPACSGGDGEPKASPEPSPSVILPSGKPTPKIPATKPTELVHTDFIVGTGRVAFPGNAITVNYVGHHFDGKEFDSSYDPGDHPLTFTLGTEHVIDGWEKGLIGMRAGGRRQLVIPPELAYGAEGRAPLIGPNETLVFVIDLISVDTGVVPGGGATFTPN